MLALTLRLYIPGVGNSGNQLYTTSGLANAHLFLTSLMYSYVPQSIIYQPKWPVIQHQGIPVARNELSAWRD